MTRPQQTTREVLEQAYARALKLHNDHWMHWSDDDIANSNENLSMFRAMLAHPTPSTTGEAFAYELSTTKFANGKQLVYKVPPALASYIKVTPLFATPPQVEPAPSTAGERDNKTEMLAKLTAWLDGLGGSIHTYSLRGIALDGFEKGWDAALLQSTADHIPDAGKMVAALPVGELPEPFHPSASHINPDYRDGWNAALAATQSAGVPVGELTLEQITRIYDRYGGDMVNCTRAIERELAAARSQPTTEESLVVAGAQPVREPLTLEELELCRQWFNGVQDTNGGYLGNADYVLAEKLYGILKIRCPSSITSVVHGITKKGAPG